MPAAGGLLAIRPHLRQVRAILTFTSSPDDEEDPRWHDPALSRPGVRPRGRGYVYDWRDATGKTFSRKAGETIAEALAFKARIDAELAAGTFVAGSKTTFAGTGISRTSSRAR